jgi:hypothetical protein
LSIYAVTSDLIIKEVSTTSGKVESVQELPYTINHPPADVTINLRKRIEVDQELSLFFAPLL